MALSSRLADITCSSARRTASQITEERSAAGDQVLSLDIESDRNVAIFSTTLLANLSTATRLDTVGFGVNTGAVCDLFREGSTLVPLSGARWNTATTVTSVARRVIRQCSVCVQPAAS